MSWLLGQLHILDFLFLRCFSSFLCTGNVILWEGVFIFISCLHNLSSLGVLLGWLVCSVFYWFAWKRLLSLGILEPAYLALYLNPCVIVSKLPSCFFYFPYLLIDSLIKAPYCTGLLWRFSWEIYVKCQVVSGPQEDLVNVTSSWRHVVMLLKTMTHLSSLFPKARCLICSFSSSRDSL